MHSPDIKSHIPVKTTSLRDKKKKMDDHLYRGSFISSTPKSACSTRLYTTTSDARSANRFEEHSMSFCKAAAHLELQVKHEAKFSSSPRTIAGVLASPRNNGNPILQTGDVKTQEWKPIAKRNEQSYRTSIFSDTTETPRAKAKGQFSDEARKSLEVPQKKTGIRVIPQKASQCMDESPNRGLKQVQTSPEKGRPNPITEGEAPHQVRQRVTEQQVSDWTKKANQGAWLPSDRVGTTTPNRVRLEKPSEVKSLFEQSSLTPKASSSNTPQYSEALKAKKVGVVGQLFNHSQYDDSKLKVTGKCGEVEYNTIKSNLNVEKSYSRVKVDIHI